jgi:hypothetical protein
MCTACQCCNSSLITVHCVASAINSVCLHTVHVHEMDTTATPFKMTLRASIEPVSFLQLCVSFFTTQWLCVSSESSCAACVQSVSGQIAASEFCNLLTMSALSLCRCRTCNCVSPSSLPNVFVSPVKAAVQRVHSVSVVK